ncbi:putative sortase SrtB family [Clostridium sp. CAG:149]|nr:putative sortase SrtB family [Clostridium sp. CAG:149]
MIFFLATVGTICCVSASAVFLKWKDDIGGKVEYKELRSLVELEPSTHEKELKISKNIIETYLKEINPDYAAWLYIPGTTIDYPVVWPENNQVYLRRSFKGEKRSCGTLFFDSAVQPFTALNTVIHGHNMRSGEMFGSLKKYLDNDYWKKHQFVYLYARGDWKQYQIFSVYQIKNTDLEPYFYLFSTSKDFHEWVDCCMAKSMIQEQKAGEEIKEILTLSTCHGKEEKLIVHAALIE